MSYTVQAAEPDASATLRGVVNTGAQTFAGDKTFTGKLVLSASDTPVNLTGVASGNYAIRLPNTSGIFLDNSNTRLYWQIAGSNALFLESSALEGSAALAFRSAVGSGSVGFQLNNAGARFKLSGGGSTDYLSSDGATKITAAGAFEVIDAFAVANGIKTLSGSPNVLRNSAATKYLSFSDANGIEIHPNTGLRVRLVGAATIDGVLTVDTDGALFKAGTSSGAISPAGVIAVRSTPAGNVGGGEDDLQSITLSANLLNQASRSIRYLASGSTANNANAKTLKAYFGASMISAALTVNIASDWTCEAVITRTGANAQRYVVKITETNQATGAVKEFVAQGTLTQTEGGTIAMKFTGTGTSDNDLVQNLFISLYL